MGFMTDAFGFVANFSFYGFLSFASIGLVWWKIPTQTHLEKSVKYAKWPYCAHCCTYLLL